MLLKISYLEPWWSESRADVCSWEQRKWGVDITELVFRELSEEGEMCSRVAQESLKCQWRTVCQLSSALGKHAKGTLTGMCLELEQIHKNRLLPPWETSTRSFVRIMWHSLEEQKLKCLGSSSALILQQRRRWASYSILLRWNKWISVWFSQSLCKHLT